MKIGGSIRNSRVSAEFSLRALAGMLGITPTLLGEYERGVTEVPGEMLDRIGKLLPYTHLSQWLMWRKLKGHVQSVVDKTSDPVTCCRGAAMNILCKMNELSGGDHG